MRVLVPMVVSFVLLATPQLSLAQSDGGSGADQSPPVIQPSLAPATPAPPCLRETQGFDMPVSDPCQPLQLQPLLPGFVTAQLVSLPQTSTDVFMHRVGDGPSYVKPSFPSGVPLSCGATDCIKSIVNQVPSPVGETLFDNIGAAPGWTVTLELDEQAVYAYNVANGTRQGYAWQVWEAMPSAQKEAYLSAVLTAVEAWHTELQATVMVKRVARSGPDLEENLAEWDGSEAMFAAGQPFRPGPRTIGWAAHLP